MIHKYLVIGKNGTIGSALYARLQSMGASVWGTIHRPEAVDQQNVFYLNLLDQPSSWVFPNIQFDIVYLCAGICRMDLCEEDHIRTRQTNVKGMIALACHFSDAGATVVYLSTNQVFSGNVPFVSATAPYQPQNEYGHQKAETEDLLKRYCQQWIIVRLTKVVEQNMLLIKNWIDLLTNNQPIQSFHDMMLAPVSLREVIDVLVLLGKTKQTGYYQISGAVDISYYILANYLADCLGRSRSLVESVSAIEKGVKKIFLPLVTTLDCSSTIAFCDWKPPHFSEVVHECFDISVCESSVI
ncbi:MAG: sugar nucleotide-binding protein [Gammaproteobacteria bacterium]|nr:sugar nucleotide-binding protein [Gammaproteobacteria bacterium]